MDIGAPELLIIFLIIVLLFGPGRLVNLGKDLGNGIREFREGLQGENKPDETAKPEE